MNVTFNSNAYIKERTLIYISGITEGNFVNMVEIDEEVLEEPVIYTPSADGSLVIDVTDLIRIYAASSINELGIQLQEVDAEGEDVGTSTTCFITIAGDTNPAQWLVPNHPVMIWQDMGLGMQAGLPSKILESIGIAHRFPIYGYNTTTNDYLIFVNGSSQTITDERLRLSMTARVIEVKKKNQSATLHRQSISLLAPCRTYAAVEWRDRLGMIKRTTWELRAAVENTLGEIELEQIENAYDVRKGKEITATLHLEGLTAYDVWYYGDIATSSDVRVGLSISDYDSGTDRLKTTSKVAVTTNKVEIPNGDDGKLYTLDIEIKFKRYDTI